MGKEGGNMEQLTFTAVGVEERVTKVPAASYRTAGLDDCSKL